MTTPSCKLSQQQALSRLLVQIRAELDHVAKKSPDQQASVKKVKGWLDECLNCLERGDLNSMGSLLMAVRMYLEDRSGIPIPHA
jgi:hypothetical protein